MQVLNTRQIAGFMMAFQPYVMEPEAACKLLLEGPGGGGGGQGGDPGHFMAGAPDA